MRACTALGDGLAPVGEQLLDFHRRYRRKAAGSDAVAAAMSFFAAATSRGEFLADAVIPAAVRRLNRKGMFAW